MAMTRAQGLVTIDGVLTKVEMGEIAKLTVPFGLRVEMSPSDEIPGTGKAVLQRAEPWALGDEIAAFVALEALAKDISTEDVLQLVRKRLASWHFPTGRPSDSRGFGEGHSDPE